MCSLLKSILLFVLSIGLTGLFAQEAITSSCGDLSGTDGSVSYSVGQLVCSIKAGTSGTLAEGIHQPYEVSMVGIEDDDNMDFESVVYPNPTSNILILKTSAFEKEGLVYRLYDSSGKLIEVEIITGKETIIRMKNLLPAPYLLTVCHNQKVLKTFKIIKNR